MYCACVCESVSTLSLSVLQRKLYGNKSRSCLVDGKFVEKYYCPLRSLYHSFRLVSTILQYLCLFSILTYVVICENRCQVILIIHFHYLSNEKNNKIRKCIGIFEITNTRHFVR